MLINGQSFSPLLDTVFIAKNGVLYPPENVVKIMQLVLLMSAKVKFKTEDLGLTSGNFHVVELV